MTSHAKNAPVQDLDVERAYQVLLAQKCWECGGPGARHVLYAKSGPEVPGVEYMNDKGLLDAGFENVGFVHSRSDKGGSCYEKLMANKPKGMQMQLVVRESAALRNWLAAKDRAREKKAAIAGRWSALEKAVSKPVPAPEGKVEETEPDEATGDLAAETDKEEVVESAAPTEESGTSTPKEPLGVTVRSFADLGRATMSFLGGEKK